MIQIALHERHKVKRVFFHELGHYISSKLNERFYSGFGPKHFKIYRCKNKYDEFCGEVAPNIPEEYENSTMFFDRLPENLVGSIYGCIFQCYFTYTRELNYCFDQFGVDDMFKYNGTLIRHKLGLLKRLKLQEVYYQHFIEIFDNKSLEKLKQIDYILFLVPCEGEMDSYDINLSELDNNIEEFLEEYIDIYSKFVDNFKNVIFE